MIQPRRILRLVGLSTLGVGGVALASLLPDLMHLVPGTLVRHPVEWGAGFAIVGSILIRSRSGAIAGRVDRAADRGLGTMPAVTAVACLGLIATWLPLYLTWPINRDDDAFATLAMGWDQGIRPYRDARAYNFPGHTYLFWALGRLVGWDRITAPYLGLDAAGTVALVLGLAWWGRRRLGGALPGLIAAMAVLRLCCNHMYGQAAQRDGHVGLLVALGLILIQSRPGRATRLGSAGLAAIALAIRPQVVVFLPAFLAAIDAESVVEGQTGRVRMVRVGAWVGVFAVGAALAFAPIWANGLAGDFLRSIRLAAPGGPYSKATPAIAWRTLGRELGDPRVALPLGLTLLIAVLGPAGIRGTARPWVVAGLGALAYAPISPVGHTYLLQPLNLMASIAFAFPAACVLTTRLVPTPIRLVTLVLLAYEAIGGSVPAFCSIEAGSAAAVDLILGRSPVMPPPGIRQDFYVTAPGVSEDWRNHRDLIAYLRERTGPTTSVANLLNRFPYEPINAASGRPSPLRCESGVCWLMWVAIDLDPEFAADVERAEAGAVVVWEPDQSRRHPSISIPRTCESVRRFYRPEAKFGRIEVWRRSADSPHS